jgi:hypothetical protein
MEDVAGHKVLVELDDWGVMIVADPRRIVGHNLSPFLRYNCNDFSYFLNYYI